MKQKIITILGMLSIAFILATASSFIPKFSGINTFHPNVMFYRFLGTLLLVAIVRVVPKGERLLIFGITLVVGGLPLLFLQLSHNTLVLTFPQWLISNLIALMVLVIWLVMMGREGRKSTKSE